MRINRVDTFRAVAILFVIYLHTISIANPFVTMDFPLSPEIFCGFFLLQISRFAVPFFLIISGYFFGCKLKQGANSFQLGKKYNSRILFALFFWNVVYLFSPVLTDNVLKYGLLRPIYWHARSLIKDPVNLIFQGTKAHLWFLVSLLLALWSLALMVHFCLKKRTIYAVSAVFFCAGLLIGSYSSSPIGIHVNLFARNFIFLSLPCVVIGWTLSSSNLENYSRYAAVLMGLGFVMQLAEIYLIEKYWHAFVVNGYSIGTIFLSTGVALSALRKTNNDSKTILARCGRLTLGIYGVHFVFIEMFEPLALQMPLSLRITVFPVLVLIISLTAAFALSRTRLKPAVV